MKNRNQIFGDLGEVFAMLYLKKNHYIIIDCKYTSPYGEIDIIAYKKNVFIFIEVKTRSSDFILPQMAVDKHKEDNIKDTALDFRNKFDILKRKYRFDIIEVIGKTPHDFKLNHIKRAF